MPEISDSYTPVLKEGFLFEPIPEGCLLLEEATGNLITLNSAAEAVLTYCDNALSVAEICRIVEEEWQVPRDEVRQAIARLMELGVLIAPPSHEPDSAPS